MKNAIKVIIKYELIYLKLTFKSLNRIKLKSQENNKIQTYKIKIKSMSSS